MELCIINLLNHGELYGYDLVIKLSRTKGLALTEGTIYLLLSRMKRAGLVRTRLVESDSGPARKYYALTDEGREASRQMNLYWRQLQSALSQTETETETATANEDELL